MRRVSQPASSTPPLRRYPKQCAFADLQATHQVTSTCAARAHSRGRTSETTTIFLGLAPLETVRARPETRAIDRPRSLRHRRQLSEYCANALAPRFAQGIEIGVTLLEAATNTQLEAVSLIAHQIDRHAYGKIAAHRGV